MKIPDFAKIKKSATAWKVNSYFESDEWKKKSKKSQHTIISDEKILSKIGLRKNENLLIIAGYYGNWANSLAQAGAKVTYSELSKTLVSYVKRKYSGAISNFICSNYVNLPKKENEFDWTVSFEPVGGESGLPIAIIRSLMNRKGIKIIHYPRENKPEQSYERYSLIAEVYSCHFTRKKVFLKGINQKGKDLDSNHIITTIETNPASQKMAKEDIKSLEKNKFSKDSATRLSRISLLISKEFLKEE